MRKIDPHAAQRRVADGARLIDIRERGEHRRERIAGGACLPLPELSSAALREAGASGPVIFHCRSGMRTQAHGLQLAEAASGLDAYVLEGGIDGWIRAGLPVVHDRSVPIDLGRQVQIAAGSGILAGSLLAASVSPWFLLISGGMGAGLIFAGASGRCGLAKVLACMPWNRVAG